MGLAKFLAVRGMARLSHGEQTPNRTDPTPMLGYISGLRARMGHASGPVLTWAISTVRSPYTLKEGTVGRVSEAVQLSSESPVRWLEAAGGV